MRGENSLLEWVTPAAEERQLSQPASPFALAAGPAGSAQVRLSHPLFAAPSPPAATFSGCGRAPQPAKARV